MDCLILCSVIIVLVLSPVTRAEEPAANAAVKLIRQCTVNSEHLTPITYPPPPPRSQAHGPTGLGGRSSIFSNTHRTA